MRKTSLILLLALVLAFAAGAGPVSAYSVTATVELPVRIFGAGCTVKLEPMGNTNPGTSKSIAANASDTLAFDCTGEIGVPYHFDLRVTNGDTSSVAFDKTHYIVTIQLRSTGGVTGYTITADSGEEGDEGKPIELTFTNIDIYSDPIPVQHDPPVRKVIDGLPEVPSEFVFTFTRNSITNPMPEGSIGGQKQMTVVGAGFAEFGIITFTSPGRYEYTIAEKDTGEKGYDYDPAVYTVRYDVEDAGGYLTCVRTFFKDGEVVEYLTAATFTNKYEKPVEPTPGPDDPTPGPDPDDPGTGGEKPDDDMTPPAPGTHPDDTPKTGDDSNLALWTMIALGSFGLGFVLTAVWLVLRRLGTNNTYA